VRTRNMEQDVLDNTARFTRVIEDHIRDHPDEWVWMHNRWKRAQPDLGRSPSALAVRVEVP